MPMRYNPKMRRAALGAWSGRFVLGAVVLAACARAPSEGGLDLPPPSDASSNPCPPAGAEACTKADEARCTGTKLETCATTGGCLVWRPIQDCAGLNKICDGKACVSSCTSDCSSLGARRCVPASNNFETCKEVESGCLKWQDATDCGTGKVCNGAGDCKSTACNNNCAGCCVDIVTGPCMPGTTTSVCGKGGAKCTNCDPGGGGLIYCHGDGTCGY